MGARKILSIVGARPQFVKAAAVSHALQAISNAREVVVHTGQHYDHNMSAVFFRELDIPEPDYHLGVGSASHGQQTGRMLERIEEVLLKEQPDWVVVYGDTNSTLAGALAAAKLNLPLAHVEAGLRSFNRHMPEEINRVLTDHCSALLFAPTITAVGNLRREGIEGPKVQLVGDVMYDIALQLGETARVQSAVLRSHGLEPGNYVLATVHRVANTDDRHHLQTILTALRVVSEQLPVVFVVHPRTRAAMENAQLVGSLRPNGSLKLIEPVGYLDMTALESQASVIATDSGGVQKEAFFHKVPCVTLREETEWPELVELGWNRLCPPRCVETVAEVVLHARGSRGADAQPYGDGHAAERIANALLGS